MIPIKRNHHYIWQHYLRSWAVDNNIYYVSPTGKISYDSIKGLAKETDFYKINLLNNIDVEFIKMWSDKSSDYFKKLHNIHLNKFYEFSNLLELAKKLNVQHESIAQASNAFIHNSLEDLHSIYENRSVEVISNLANGNNILQCKNENMHAFCSYVGHQLTRTKAFKEKSQSFKNQVTISSHQEEMFFSLYEKNWWFISFILGLNVGESLFNTRDIDHHIFIKNSTEHPFITSDSPVINIYSNIKNNIIPDKLDLYIPLSPSYAYMINNTDNYNHLRDKVYADDVLFLNKKIASQSYKTIFSNEKNQLESLKNITKT